MKIGPVGAELFSADGQLHGMDGRTDGRTDRKTDMTKIMVAIRSFCERA
jgi:hypothetical protein